MALQIVLDDSKQLGMLHCYTPEQPVTGRVIYTPKQAQENIKDVSVHFEGRGNIKEDDYKSGWNAIPDVTKEYLLFHQEKQLFQGPFTVTQQNFTWPFQFVFPRQSPTQGDSRPLPPSFSQYFMEKFGHYPGFEVLIRYEFRTVVDYSSALQPRTSSRVQVAFRTFATSPTPKPQIQECNLKSATAHSLKQKLNPFHSKKLSVNPQVAASLPKILAPNLTQPLLLWIQSPTEFEKSKLVLKDIELVLQSSTKCIYDSRAIRKEGTFSLSDLNIHLPSTGEEICICADFGLETIYSSPYLAPDFSSSNPYIDHTHIIKVQAKMLDEESSHVYDLEGDCPVTVLPPQQPKN